MRLAGAESVTRREEYREQSPVAGLGKQESQRPRARTLKTV